MASNTSRGPETATVSLPAAITLGLPLTGVARKSEPREFAASRISVLASAETVEASAITRGDDSPVSSPPSPSMTSSRSLDEDTMANTRSRSARSTGRVTTDAPLSASSWAFDAVRL